MDQYNCCNAIISVDPKNVCDPRNQYRLGLDPRGVPARHDVPVVKRLLQQILIQTQALQLGISIAVQQDGCRGFRRGEGSQGLPGGTLLSLIHGLHRMLFLLHAIEALGALQLRSCIKNLKTCLLIAKCPSSG